jgi:DNA polymerase III alpha subunit (gram-positive type)
MPNLVFLELDTTGLHDDAEIIRAVVLNTRGQVIMDLFARPSQPITDSILSIAGITAEQINSQGIPARDLLQQLQEILTGKYLLSYNLDFDRGKLKGAARRQQLNEIQIIGEDLMIRTMHYFSLTNYPRLDALCERIGYPLPKQPHQTAIDRARGQSALLNAMTDVIINHRAPTDARTTH